MDRRRFIATVAVFLLAVISVTTGEDGQNNQTQIQENVNATIVTQNNTEPEVSPQLKDSTSSKDHDDDYFEWNNTDDYSQYPVDDPAAYNPSLQPSHRRRNENRTRSNATETEIAGNESISNSNGTNSEVSENNETILSDSQENENANNSNATSNVDAETNKNETASETEPAASAEETEEPTTNSDKLSSIPLETSKKPSAIETQDVGDSYTNVTTPAGPLITEFDNGDGLRAWSVVVVSVLVSFAVIFTILYFVRGALIR
ncbi:unnamed protein product [Orchesella dallaii]